MIKNHDDIRWDSLSRIIIFCFLALGLVRWRILPQFMDIYYHLSVSWGLLQAGGYSGWDFWQYAPLGRPHIYPPLFHIILAALIKLGVNKIILAKIFETIIPIAFLVTTWLFIRKRYAERLAFFMLLSTAVSYSFYMSMINHIPATLAIIFGIVCLDQLLDKKMLRAALLLVLCFYTHIGTSWFFALAIILYGAFNKEYAKICLRVFILALILSSPVIFKQLAGLKSISRIGLNLSERHYSHFKPVEYLLALIGLAIAVKHSKKYHLFLCLFIASFIFLTYPYRFFSAEGYLPIIFLSAVAFDKGYNRIKAGLSLRYAAIAAVLIYTLFISPTVLKDRSAMEEGKAKYTLRFSHTAFMGLFFPENQNRGFFTYIWFAYTPEKYISAARIIKDNSDKSDIIYSNLNLLGLCLASLSERATANGLFPEIKPREAFDPILSSKIVVLTKDLCPDMLTKMENHYQLIKVGENELFTIYKNTACKAKVRVYPASVPFWAIGVACGVLIFFYKKK